MELKWVPINSSSPKEIGVLGLLTANGHVYIYNMPIIDPEEAETNVITLTPQVDIFYDKIYFTQFSWSPLSPCDKLLIGDAVGNIYYYDISVSREK